MNMLHTQTHPTQFTLLHAQIIHNVRKVVISIMNKWIVWYKYVCNVLNVHESLTIEMCRFEPIQLMSFYQRNRTSSIKKFCSVAQMTGEHLLRRKTYTFLILLFFLELTLDSSLEIPVYIYDAYIHTPRKASQVCHQENNRWIGAHGGGYMENNNNKGWDFVKGGSLSWT